MLKKCGLADKLSKLQQFLTQPRTCSSIFVLACVLFCALFAAESKDSSVVRFDKLSHVPGMDSTSLTAAFQAFYGCCFSFCCCVSV